MDDPPPTGAKGHARNKSAAKASRPRSSTKGPLDAIDEPITAARQQVAAGPGPALLSPTASRAAAPGQLSPAHRSPLHSPARSPGAPTTPRTSLPKSFAFLLRPEIYHPLTALDVPAPFRGSGASQHQPDPDASVDELLAQGHFRAAAIAAVQELTSTTTGNGRGRRPPVDPADHARIFALLYARLSCLTLIGATALAAQEVRALEDLGNASLYVDDLTGEHLVPWDLRVLNVRLQALGFGDPRRSVMSYHELAREAREGILAAARRHDHSASELWKGRLGELGLHVAGALVEMEDLTGAAHHLASLGAGAAGAESGRLRMARALLWLHLGDVDAARACVTGLGTGAGETARADRVVGALCDMAEGEYAAALDKWRAIGEDGDGADEMVGVNEAVCLLYLGRMDEGRDVLEGLVDGGFSSHTLLFNLSTMYELCTERNRAMKMRLAEKVAGQKPSMRGWEKSNADFKL